ncbi:uncharacterized protein N7515_001055 [Penicillium bovifimosum]|uniref:Uncharacterized protein n=1 Tax=Penicillium bovifimosum TaxID=126998 RepID=A0A9W9HGV7_9EURO|nr:uncharacterized protein N7515_001055 [Penicillium bovifimosum]KAJ5146491.1 hypothetical protein N7515_001055 [Penicillium bovifimosum]
MAPPDNLALPEEQKRPGTPFTGTTSRTAASAALVEASESPPRKSSNIRNQRIDGPWLSETGPSGAVPSTTIPAISDHRLQQAQREIIALNNKLADAEDIIARQEIEKADSKPKESSMEPRIYCDFIVPRESPRSQNKEEIARLSAKFDVLEARYKEAMRALEKAEGDTDAGSAWRGKYGSDDEAWKALSDLVEEIDDDNLRIRHTDGQGSVHELLAQESKVLGMEFLKHRQRHAQREIPSTEATTGSIPQGSQSIKRLKHATEVNDLMSNPTENQIAEFNQPHDGSQTGEYLAPPDGYMEWQETKECLLSPWTPIHRPPLVEQIPQAEERMGSVDWTLWTERKRRISRRTVVEASPELLARIDEIQPCNGQVAEETVRKTESLLLGRDESIPARSIQPVHLQLVPAQPVLQVQPESVQTEEALTPEVVSQSAISQPTINIPQTSEQVPLEAAMSVHKVHFATVPTEVPTQTTMSVLTGSQTTPTTQTVLEYYDKVATEGVLNEPALYPQAHAALKPSPPEDNNSAWSDEERWPALESQGPSETGPTSPTLTMPGSYVFDTLDEVVQAPAAVELSFVHESTHGSLRTGTRSHLEVLLSQREERRQTESALMPTPEGLQVASASRDPTSSQVASPEDGPATGTVRAAVSEGAERVEDADSPEMLSEEQTTGERREQSGGREATSGHQKPDAKSSGPPAVTATSEASDMQEGSALLKELWVGARRLTFGLSVLMILILWSFPLWARYLGHWRYAMEGPEQFLSELREEHGYGVPIVGRLIYIFLRFCAGDRTLFG